MIVYVDTSVVAKTLIDEVDSGAAVAALDRYGEHGRLFSSSIVITELRRAASRAGVDVATTRDALRRLSLVQVNDELLETAGELPGLSLRSLDAIHIASAMSIDANVFVTADIRQAVAARDAGLDVIDQFA